MSERGSSTRSEAKRRTRERLLEAGTKLLRDQGLDGPSLDAICEHAGYTRGAFYVHFRDRDDFIEAVMARVGEQYLDAVLGQASAGDDLATIAGRFVASIADGSYPLTGSIRPHQLLDACFRSEAIRERYVGLVRETIARVESSVGAAQAGGVVDPAVSPEHVATLLLAAVIGAQTMMELGISVDVPGAAGVVLRMLAAGR